MSTDSRGYWREEFSLIALLLLFFIAIVALSYHIPFDARLFPLLIGSAGILLTLGFPSSKFADAARAMVRCRTTRST